ncbi:alpha-(1,3)-fucosyltransferase [Plakobranchus ocellatus]|uniref:Fucosyltransferase n=1 Tax=Plakobranchus ocellatus TaxID=259542 RepID=A0AAV3Y579_9GAST|nr:alpha-(1,3)-fucosyltransferase [Plakobranchus ocellatus]
MSERATTHLYGSSCLTHCLSEPLHTFARRGGIAKCLVLAVFMLASYLVFVSVPVEDGLVTADDMYFTKRDSHTKLILFADFPDYYEIESRQGVNGLAHCNAKSPSGRPMRCEITVNKGSFPQADAVLFYSHGKTHMSQLGFEPEKQPGQTWTFFAVESPVHSKNSLFNDAAFHDKFNSTMGYRTDSEFWHGYIRSQKRDSPLSTEDKHSEEAELRRIFRKKSKMAAMFVSNCEAPSRRDEYVRELQKHMSVDVYGRCGSMRCDDREACDKMLKDDYKFYLAFENSHCLDYVTEKLLKIMKSKSVVPVVRGGADYSRLFPENSVVDTSQFSSPAHLAIHLKELSENEDLWVQMFQWTWQWEVHGPDLPFCQYCHHLFSDQRSSHLYHNVYQWWAKDTCYPIKDLPPKRTRGADQRGVLASFIDKIEEIFR